MRKNIFKVLLIIFVITCIFIFVGNIYNKVLKLSKDSVNKMELSKLEDLPLESKIPEDYKLIIDKLYWNKLFPKVTRRSKVNNRNPLSLINFDNHFNLFIYKINIGTVKSLNKIFNTEKETITELPVGITYNGIDGNGYDFLYKSGSVEKTDSIYFNYNSDTLDMKIKNDSILSFHLCVNNFAISYTKNGLPDIILQGSKAGILGNLSSCFNMVFYKKANNIFLLTLSGNGSKVNLPDDLLYKIIKK